MSLSSEDLKDAVKIALDSLAKTNDAVYRDVDEIFGDNSAIEDEFIEAFEDMMCHYHAVQLVDNDIDITESDSRFNKAISASVAKAVALVLIKDKDFMDDLSDKDYRSFEDAAESAEDALSDLDGLLDELADLDDGKGRRRKKRDSGRDRSSSRSSGRKSKRKRGSSSRRSRDNDRDESRGRTKRKRRGRTDREEDGGRNRSDRHSTYNTGEEKEEPKNDRRARRSRSEAKDEIKRSTRHSGGDDTVVYADFGNQQYRLDAELIPGLSFKPDEAVVYNPQTHVSYVEVGEVVTVKIVEKGEMENYADHEIKHHAAAVDKNGGRVVAEVDFTNLSEMQVSEAIADVKFSQGKVFEYIKDGKRLSNEHVTHLLTNLPYEMNRAMQFSPLTIPSKLLEHVNATTLPITEIKHFSEWLRWAREAREYSLHNCVTIEERSACRYFIQELDDLLTARVNDLLAVIDDHANIVSFMHDERGFGYLNNMFKHPDNSDYYDLWNEIEVEYVRHTTRIVVKEEHHVMTVSNATTLFVQTHRLLVSVRGDLTGSLQLTSNTRPAKVDAELTPELYEAAKKLVALREQKKCLYDIVLVDSLGTQFQVLANKNIHSPIVRIRAL